MRTLRIAFARETIWGRLHQDTFEGVASSPDRSVGSLRPRAEIHGSVQSQDAFCSRCASLPILRAIQADESAESRPRRSSFSGWQDDLGECGLLMHFLQQQEGWSHAGASGYEVTERTDPSDSKPRHLGDAERPSVSFMEDVPQPGRFAKLVLASVFPELPMELKQL